jgi:hypothetical protein
VGGFDEGFRISYDWDCWIRLLLDGARAGMVDEPYYEYRLHPGALTANRVASLWERVRVLEKAGRHPGLSPLQSDALGRSLRRHRTRAALAETGAALRSPGRRMRLLELAASTDVEMRARIGALLAATVPAVARRLIQPEPLPDERLVEARR